MSRQGKGKDQQVAQRLEEARQAFIRLALEANGMGAGEADLQKYEDLFAAQKAQTENSMTARATLDARHLIGSFESCGLIDDSFEAWKNLSAESVRAYAALYASLEPLLEKVRTLHGDMLHCVVELLQWQAIALGMKTPSDFPAQAVEVTYRQPPYWQCCTLQQLAADKARAEQADIALRLYEKSLDALIEREAGLLLATDMGRRFLWGYGPDQPDDVPAQTRERAAQKMLEILAGLNDVDKGSIMRIAAGHLDPAGLFRITLEMPLSSSLLDCVMALKDHLTPEIAGRLQARMLKSPPNGWLDERWFLGLAQFIAPHLTPEQKAGLLELRPHFRVSDHYRNEFASVLGRPAIPGPNG